MIHIPCMIQFKRYTDLFPNVNHRNNQKFWKKFSVFSEKKVDKEKKL